MKERERRKNRMTEEPKYEVEHGTLAKITITMTSDVQGTGR